MEIKTIPYKEYLSQVPKSGYHILCQQTDDKILVYQAFNHDIADFAIKNQKFGGDHYSFSRMSWIKPNFLWMMYRCGWAEKANQERVLGIWITKSGFVEILNESVYSSFKSDLYDSEEAWREKLKKRNVRLQWDPDHDIYGAKQARRAIQLGLKKDALFSFNQNMIQSIIDLTDFVKTEKLKISKGSIEELVVPKETTFKTGVQDLNIKLKIE